jgi:hypothetical protein
VDSLVLQRRPQREHCQCSKITSGVGDSYPFKCRQSRSGYLRSASFAAVRATKLRTQRRLDLLDVLAAVPGPAQQVGVVLSDQLRRNLLRNARDGSVSRLG